MRSLIFLEGPAYAGKTTFLKAQAMPHTLKLPEASEFLGGDANFPDAPHDLKSMLYCSYFFSYMENERLRQIDTAPDDTVTILADRFTPFSSLLFYQLRYREGAISAEDYALGIQLSSKTFCDNLYIPRSIARHRFILFTIASEADFVKRLGRGTRNEDFNSWANFQYLVTTYRQLLPSNTEEVGGANTDATDQAWIEGTKALKQMLRPEHFRPPGLTLPSVDDPTMQSIIEQYISPDETKAIKNHIQELLQ